MKPQEDYCSGVLLGNYSLDATVRPQGYYMGTYYMIWGPVLKSGDVRKRALLWDYFDF